ncbi:nitric oxide reductase activation protein NorD [Thioclava atlantica]|uniref:VWFA domain-containing protein n=1 Tax=Thioclava atlantica TaxID=1317124 RepID=A0A085TZM5_9RHOB|nr:VWA domain-containing protein [Thioclava atlantica]KFE36172.1 hypothetical protein DW2_02639 [Thioclava atlantica]
MPDTLARGRSDDLPAAIGAAFTEAEITGWLGARDRLRGAGYGRSVPLAFERSSALLAPRVGADATAALAGIVSSCAIRVSPRAAERLCTVAEVVSRKFEARDFASWSGMMRRLVTQAPESVDLLLGNMERLISRLSQEALEDWVATGHRSAGGDAGKRAAYFALRTEEALRSLEHATGDQSFYDCERRLRAYLTAISGSSPPLRAAPPAGQGGAVRRASFAGGVVLVPPSFPGYRGEAEPLFRAALAHISAHLRFTPRRFEIGQLKPLQMAVVSLIEDARVEQLAAQDMPGLQRLWKGFHVARPGGLPTAPSLFARLSRALIDPDFADEDGWVTKGRRMFFEARHRWDDPGLSREIGNLLGNDLGQLRVQFNAKDYVVQPAYRDDNLGLWALDEPSPDEAQTLEVKVDLVKLRRSEPAPTPTTHPPRQDASQSEKIEKRAAVSEDREEGRMIATYPEYDYAIGRDRPNWTMLREYRPAPGDARFWENLRQEQGPLLSRVSGLIRSAQIGRARREKRQAEGEVLDLDACIEAATALRAGEFPDHRIYERQAPPTRDLAVSLLLDISQSTAEGAEDAGRSILALERDAAAVLAHAMNEMGDPFAINAFSSVGREDVRFVPIKSFAAPLDDRAGAALSGLRPGYSTRLGAALRHAGQELAQVPRHRRLLLLITDGEPSDIDCPDPEYLLHDARRAVRSLAAIGIDVFCVGLGSHNKEQQSAIFGRSGFVQVERLAALPDKLVSLYFRLTR